MRNLGVGRGTDNLIKPTGKARGRKKKASNRPQATTAETIRASYLLPASTVKGIKRLALDTGQPVKEVVRQALEKVLKEYRRR